MHITEMITGWYQSVVWFSLLLPFLLRRIFCSCITHKRASFPLAAPANSETLGNPASLSS